MKEKKKDLLLLIFGTILLVFGLVFFVAIFSIGYYTLFKYFFGEKHATGICKATLFWFVCFGMQQTCIKLYKKSKKRINNLNK